MVHPWKSRHVQRGETFKFKKLGGYPLALNGVFFPTLKLRVFFVLIKNGVVDIPNKKHLTSLWQNVLFWMVLNKLFSINKICFNIQLKQPFGWRHPKQVQVQIIYINAAMQMDLRDSTLSKPAIRLRFCYRIPWDWYIFPGIPTTPLKQWVLI